MRNLSRTGGSNGLSRRSLLLSAAATMAVAACDVPAIGPIGGGPGADRSRPVAVALMVPGGGADEERNTLARNLENAARLAVADLQGVEIDLRIYQTGGSASQAATLAARAINDGAQIIVGPLFADSARAVGPVAAQAGINVLSFSNNPDVAGGNVFLLGPMFEPTATRILTYAASQGRGRVMILSEQSQAGEVAERAMQRAAQRTGASIVASESYAFSQQGIVDALPRISSTARSSGAQSIFLTANSAGALPLLAELLPENGISPSSFQYMGLTRWDIPPATLQLSGLQGGWFALPDPTLTAQFESRYRAAYGATPNAVAALAYDGIAAVGALASRGGSAPFSAASLTQGSGFAGVTGVFRLRADGSNERGLAIAEIRDQRVNVLSPAPRSFAGGGS
ncbi:penicillin-binding protein activator [Roseinatronobacter bogoriensis]|uniref:Penicillin-binding protein activator n=1 Tax=Roseinatronobacter bogoriensis subsp. barguzinensis TaxID=441209 RepID=A0A2K8KHS6_9RHOB|nr:MULTISPECIES: penicillin-binding protein activator [Rhodobaca]ATX66388.1 penicillin-binding protein activator [Rhodobaca barguzinensis]MBB4207526.1 ABC-type branched-subunit amino acid transport system substrate-binding protein [Rhodobaca bogoriensis DSM 18756]TDW40167.1 amino acid/amide ABC transporter substrate-binding protein (HAAT family) [Rhodobaca barguzinensis]TDY70681.1 amino acid/amide ABC transporter substrate-binding protein (HAAT family) [Rhodobaca bogoriensis DSM 18756]